MSLKYSSYKVKAGFCYLSQWNNTPRKEAIIAPILHMGAEPDMLDLCKLISNPRVPCAT